MFCAIEHVHFPGHRLCRDQVRVLGHITRPVDLALVVDFLNDLNTRLRGYGVSTQFAAFVIIVCTVESVRAFPIAFW